MNASLIKVQGLVKSYSDRRILDGISFSVAECSNLAIIGPSGSGKSTILKILLGLEPSDGGSVYLGSDSIGMAFQYSALLNSYTVTDNIMMALQNTSYTMRDKQYIVDEKLNMLGLIEYKDAMPYELSGGQQKRVDFARAIANNPQIVFYDEPTAGLDPISSTAIENYINLLTQKYRAASIIVTHQHSTIARTANQVVCLHRGKVVWSGVKDKINTDSNPYIRQFIDGNLEGPFTTDE